MRRRRQVSDPELLICYSHSVIRRNERSREEKEAGTGGGAYRGTVSIVFVFMVEEVPLMPLNRKSAGKRNRSERKSARNATTKGKRNGRYAEMDVRNPSTPHDLLQLEM